MRQEKEEKYLSLLLSTANKQTKTQNDEVQTEKEIRSL
jgi:hypothetical protein